MQDTIEQRDRVLLSNQKTIYSIQLNATQLDSIRATEEKEAKKNQWS